MSEGDEEGAEDNYDDGDDEGGTEFVEWARNPIDEGEVNRKGDKDRHGGELRTREVKIMGNNRENEHTD